MKNTKRFFAVLCLFFALMLTTRATEGHMCCPALPPPPITTTVSTTNSDVQPGGEETVLDWVMNLASGAVQFFVAVV
jgi:hypothetical protein